MYWRQSLKDRLAEVKELIFLLNGEPVFDPVQISKLMNRLAGHARELQRQIQAGKQPVLTSVEMRLLQKAAKRLKMIVESVAE